MQLPAGETESTESAGFPGPRPLGQNWGKTLKEQMKSERLTPAVTAAVEVPEPASCVPYNAYGGFASATAHSSGPQLHCLCPATLPRYSWWELGMIMSVALKIAGVPMPTSQTGSCQTPLSTPCTLQTVHLRGTLFTGLTLGMT